MSEVFAPSLCPSCCAVVRAAQEGKGKEEEGSAAQEVRYSLLGPLCVPLFIGLSAAATFQPMGLAAGVARKGEEAGHAQGEPLARRKQLIRSVKFVCMWYLAGQWPSFFHFAPRLVPSTMPPTVRATQPPQKPNA
jgi:hypothetical protein